MTSDFEAVANGSQRRVRWRSPLGWVRVERLSEHHLQIRGPRAELKKLTREVRPYWTSLLSGQRIPELDNKHDSGEVAMLLVRVASGVDSPPPAKRRPQVKQGLSAAVAALSATAAVCRGSYG